MKHNYRFQLDHSKPRKKYFCPNCHGGSSSSHRRTLVRYIDTWGEVDLPVEVGICDRKDRCGYNYTGWDYLKDHPWIGDKKVKVQAPKVTKVQPKPIPNNDYTIDEMRKTFDETERNPLFKFLSERFDANAVAKAFEAYNIGTIIKSTGGYGTIFWQVDVNGSVRGGKVLEYDKTGHRLKTDITWMHSIERRKSFILNQCLFGEHLLTTHPDKKVALVEGDKTAIIASLFMPEYMWLATGGLNQNLNHLDCLADRDVTVFPDLKAEPYWRQKMLPTLKRICQSVRFSNMLESLATPEQFEAGLDIADFLLDAQNCRDPPSAKRPQNTLRNSILPDN